MLFSFNRILPVVLLAFALPQAPMHAQQWHNLFNGTNLDGWEVRGEGIWTVMQDGPLLGQHAHPNADDPFGKWPISLDQYQTWQGRQAWLYTVDQFGEFDLHVEYWIPPQGNSGVSIRDVSRAHYAIGEPDSARPDLVGPVRSTPAHIGYEIQIVSGDNNRYPSGSVYAFVAAKRGVQKAGEWNNLDIESRNEIIRVTLNGLRVAESAGDPVRPRVGPIGLQLHDQFTFALFRNIQIRAIGQKRRRSVPLQPENAAHLPRRGKVARGSAPRP